MTELTRRSIFPLAAAGIIAAPDGSQGATLDHHGIVVKMAKRYGEWCALVPDLDSMNGHWRPGFAIPTKWMPLKEYLDLIDKTYAMDAQA